MNSNVKYGGSTFHFPIKVFPIISKIKLDQDVEVHGRAHNAHMLLFNMFT